MAWDGSRASRQTTGGRDSNTVTGWSAGLVWPRIGKVRLASPSHEKRLTTLQAILMALEGQESAARARHHFLEAAEEAGFLVRFRRSALASPASG